MKLSRIVIAVCLALLAGVLYFFYAPRTAPAGQHGLVHLNAQNFPVLRDEFNAAQDQVRMIVMLSPT